MVPFKDGKYQSAFFVILLVTGTLMATAVAYPLRIAADAAVHLQAAKMILAGAVPYLDFFDRDPPLVSYLNIPAAFISAQLQQGLPLSYQIFVCLLVLASCILVAIVLCSCPETKQSRHYPFVIAAYTLFNLIIGPEFGTREHLMLLLSTPFLFVRFLWVGGASADKKTRRLYRARHGRLKRIAVAAGVAAGVGFNLDWIFLLYPIILEVFYLLHERQLRRFLKAPEIVSLLIFTAVYVMHFFVMNSTAFSNYLNIVAPLSRAMCDVPDSVLGYVSKSPDRRDVICIFMATLVLAFLLRKRARLMMPLTIFAFTSLEIYIYRSLGFSHELLPLMLACTLIITLSVSVAFDFAVRQMKLPASVVTKSSSAMIILLAVVCVGAYGQLQSLLFDLHDAKTARDLGDKAPFVEQLSTITKAGDRVLFIDGFERPSYPLIVQLGLEPGSKWLYQFPVRAFLKLEQHQDNPYYYLLRYKDPFYKQLRQDIDELKPKFIGIESGEIAVSLDQNEQFHQILKDYQVEFRIDLNFNLYREYLKLDQHRLEVVGDEYAFLLYKRNNDSFEEPVRSWR